MKETTSSKISFLVGDEEYTLVIPDRYSSDENKNNNPRFLAIYRGKNVTKDIEVMMGPAFNFFGMTPTPQDLGFYSDDFLYIWYNKTKYTFKSDDIIDFSQPPNVYSESSSDSEDSEHETSEE